MRTGCNLHQDVFHLLPGPQKWRFSLYSTGKAKLKVGTVVPTVTESETEDIVPRRARRTVL